MASFVISGRAWMALGPVTLHVGLYVTPAAATVFGSAAHFIAIAVSGLGFLPPSPPDP